MTEYLLGNIQAKSEMRAQLILYRQNPEQFIHHAHPQVSFVTLEQLLQGSPLGSLLDLPLLRQAQAALASALAPFSNCSPFDPARCFIGVAAQESLGGFGGFYHPDQGYRYLQQIALTSLSGSLCTIPIDPTLRSLELLRAYVHDSIHAATYRLFCTLPAEAEGDLRLYRLQYGINFRRATGQSYSARDSIRSKMTRNLGLIMEGATDRFAQEYVLDVARQSGYSSAPASFFDDVLYRDCTGQLTELDMREFHAIERGSSECHLPQEEKAYLRLLRLFTQYVTLRYQTFLAECGGSRANELHVLILQAMISGKLRPLQQFLNQVCGQSRSFVTLFKTSAY